MDENSMKLQEGTQAEPLELPAADATAIHDVVIGLLVGFDEHRQPLIVFPGNAKESAQVARVIGHLSEDCVGREVALLFEQGDPMKPLVVGPVQRAATRAPAPEQQVTATVDGERLVLSADREIELRCGKARITLTRAGKVLIQGTYVSSRSSGMNRIKGGSVHLN